MLSFVYQISHKFEKKHGYRPNILYLNNDHFSYLKEELFTIRNLDTMSRILGMELVLSPSVPHPNVAWSSVDWGNALVV